MTDSRLQMCWKIQGMKLRSHVLLRPVHEFRVRLYALAKLTIQKENLKTNMIIQV